VAAATLVTGCVFVPPIEPPPPVAAEPEVAPPAPVETHVVPPAQPEPLHTAVLVSDDIPEYVRIAEEIRRHQTDRVSIHNLDGRQANAESALDEISRVKPSRVVAIGLLAATVGRRVDAPMVFCQVYNYQDHDLLSPTSKGVYLLPPFANQLEAWRNLSPDLKRIGILTGPGQEALIAEIRDVVEQSALTLTVETVQSDKEALFAFKERMTPRIDGLWLLPDNRILSPEVVREIISYSAKHRKQVVVFGDALLGLGALMSVTSDERDVAERVLARFDDMSANRRLLGPDMQQLTMMHMNVNRDVAAHLGLVVPDQIVGAR
jgi:ABC-type uncharacterized transport system substrate-binding protein